MQVPAQQKSPARYTRYLGLLIILAVIIFGVAYTLGRKNQTADVPARDYSQLRQYSATSIDKSKATFMAPEKFAKTGPGDATSSVRLEDRSGGKLIGLIVLSAAASNQTDSNSLKIYGQAVSNPDSKAYQSVTQPLIFMVNNQLGQVYKVMLGKPTAVSTPKIKSNAWEWPFTATVPNQKSLPDIQGSILLAAGKSSFFYLTQSSAKNNWQSNSAVWRQVTNSLSLSN